MKRKQDPHIELRWFSGELKVFSRLGVVCFISICVVMVSLAMVLSS